MGGMFSNETNENYKGGFDKQQTENEIRQKIDQLFLNNKTNQISEASYSEIPNLESNSELNNVDFNEDLFNKLTKDQNGGKFIPRGNPYKKYSMNECIKTLQNGGTLSLSATENYKDLSDFSEFDRVRDFMINDLNKNNQEGVNDSTKRSDLINPSLTSLSNISSSLDLRGGGASEDIFKNLTGSSPVTPIEKRFNFLGLTQDGGKRNTASNSVNLEQSFSTTSINDIGPNANIKPFYSSDTVSDYSFQHPYVKNRF